MIPSDTLRSIARGLAATWRKAVRAGIELAYAVVFLAGAALIAYGASLAWRPAGFLFAGGFLCGGVVLHVWRS